MKELMEIDFKGNVGCTIEKIVSFSKDMEAISDSEILYRYKIELVIHGNEDLQVLEFAERLIKIKEHSCFGPENDIVYWRKA